MTGDRDDDVPPVLHVNGMARRIHRRHYRLLLCGGSLITIGVGVIGGSLARGGEIPDLHIPPDMAAWCVGILLFLGGVAGVFVLTYLGCQVRLTLLATKNLDKPEEYARCQNLMTQLSYILTFGLAKGFLELPAQYGRQYGDRHGQPLDEPSEQAPDRPYGRPHHETGGETEHGEAERPHDGTGAGRSVTET